MKKRHGNGYGKGTWVESSVFLSPAFLSLGHKGKSKTVSTCSVQVCLLFLGKRSFYHWKKKKGPEAYERQDGNKLTLTYKELEARGISQPRATRAIDELLEKGFIKIVRSGGAYDKDKTIYGLVDDFKGWRPGDPPIRTRKRDILRGFQGKNKKAVKKLSHTLTGDRTHTSTRDTSRIDTYVNEGHP